MYSRNSNIIASATGFSLIISLLQIVLALAAVAAAESDPLLYSGLPYAAGLPYAYGAYGYGLPYTTAIAGYAGFNAAGVPAIKPAPCTNAAGEGVPCRLAKREAEADPALLYSGLPYASYATPYLGYSAYNAFPYTYAAPLVSQCKNVNGVPVPCRLAKREAEAEADPALLYSAYPYTTALGAYPYSYGLPYAAAGYAGFNAAGVPAIKASPCTNYLGLPVPC